MRTSSAPDRQPGASVRKNTPPNVRHLLLDDATETHTSPVKFLKPGTGVGAGSCKNVYPPRIRVPQCGRRVMSEPEHRTNVQVARLVQVHTDTIEFVCRELSHEIERSTNTHLQARVHPQKPYSFCILHFVQVEVRARMSRALDGVLAEVVVPRIHVQDVEVV